MADEQAGRFDPADDKAVDSIAQKLDIARPIEPGIYQIGNIDLSTEPAGARDLCVVFSDSPAEEDVRFWRRNCPEYWNGLEERWDAVPYHRLAGMETRRRIVRRALELHRKTLECYGAPVAA
jgi:hypothetical protein